MTLRFRLALAVVILVAIGQGAYFAVTYLAYRNSEYSQLDTQLRQAEPSVDQYLTAVEQNNGSHPNGSSSSSGTGFATPSQPPPGGGGSPQRVLPPGTWAERIEANGTVLPFYFLTSSSKPKLPANLAQATPDGRFFTVGATSGSGQFRVFEVASEGGGTTVIAIPTTEVTNALNRLVLIEAIGLGALLLAVSGGAWVVLRSGLRPLERMSQTARRISGGDLSQRVSPSGDNSEVGQLGQALNTMLGDIETAFAQRDATERRLRQFLADASHELRTPLTSIQGFAELFRLKGDDARVDLPTIFRRIESESARMRVLVEDLLTLARLDEHRPIERKPVDLSILAADACTDAVASQPDRPVTLEAPAAVVISADEAHLRQAVGNLVSNALRHTPQGTPLEVGCLVSDGHASITVRDHGPGLDEETLTHLFDRFWQRDPSRVGAGSGLGLSIVAAVAAEHGGVVTADNAPGGGAIFTLTLPVDPH